MRVLLLLTLMLARTATALITVQEDLTPLNRFSAPTIFGSSRSTSCEDVINNIYNMTVINMNTYNYYEFCRGCRNEITAYIRRADFNPAGDPTQPAVLTYVISDPGTYALAETIPYTGSAGNGTAIRISTDNVTLLLNGYALQGIDVLAQIGIEVDASLNNITIQGGAVAGFFDTAIDMVTPAAPYASNFALDELTIEGSPNGIIMQGIEGIALSTSRITNITVAPLQATSVFVAQLTGLTINSCDAGVSFDQSKDITFTNSRILQNNFGLSALSFTNTSQIALKRVECQLNTSSTTSAKVVNLSNTFNAELECCVIEKNTTTATNLYAVACDVCTALTFDRCTINSNLATGGGSSIGIWLNNSASSLIKNSEVSFQGLGIQDTAATSTAVIVGNLFRSNSTAFSVNYPQSGSVDYIETTAGGLASLRESSPSVNIVVNA